MSSFRFESHRVAIAIEKNRPQYALAAPRADPKDTCLPRRRSLRIPFTAGPSRGGSGSGETSATLPLLQSPFPTHTDTPSPSSSPLTPVNGRTPTPTQRLLNQTVNQHTLSVAPSRRHRGSAFPTPPPRRGESPPSKNTTHCCYEHLLSSPARRAVHDLHSRELYSLMVDYAPPWDSMPRESMHAAHEMPLTQVRLSLSTLSLQPTLSAAARTPGNPRKHRPAPTLRTMRCLLLSSTVARTARAVSGQFRFVKRTACCPFLAPFWSQHLAVIIP